VALVFVQVDGNQHDGVEEQFPVVGGVRAVEAEVDGLRRSGQIDAHSRLIELLEVVGGCSAASRLDVGETLVVRCQKRVQAAALQGGDESACVRMEHILEQVPAPPECAEITACKG